MARQYLDLARIYGAVDNERANKAQLEAQNMQMENMRYQQQRQMKQDGLQDQKRGIYAGAVTAGEDGKPILDRKKLIADMLGVDGEEALTRQAQFDTQDATAAKTKREAQKFEIENKSATVKYLKDKLATVQDDAGFQAFKQEATELGAQDLVKSAPQQYDPQWQQSQMVNADKFLERNTPKYERVDLGGKIQVVDVNPVTNPKFAEMNLSKTATISELESQRHNRIQEGISGAQLGISKDRLNFDRSGGVTAVNAKNGINTNGEKLTEGMRNNAMYAQRMTAAEKLLGGTTEQKPGVMETIAGSTPLIGSELGANQLRSPDRQKAVQAQRDWVRAKLRKESGAAIAVDEMNQEIATYFPQIGDSPDVIAQKKIAREQATQGLIQSSGSAYSPPAERQAPIMNKEQAKMGNKPLATVKSDNDYNKLPKGTRFKAPDGSIRVKQ
jgi:hypothetical protein